ncbi:hypothetical protein DH2020_000924 [Rehmannia glutinosa]|uniref:DUF4228 domain protein n=1 Tax=Rehmannia glutinosa TaxID=99300 RepID=A0ABR0XYK9_REHGL
MGNAIIKPCFRPEYYSPSSAVKLISYGGATRLLTGKHLAGEIMFEFPDRMVCHADSFFIGHPIPSLAIDDELVRGQTYFLLPLDRVTQDVLSVSSLAGLGSDPNSKRGSVRPCGFKGCPFEYTKGSNGRVLIKVMPEFITMLISKENYNEEMINNGDELSVNGGNNSPLCNTPELHKHYNQLVGAKDHIWSPKLETISEYKIRFSPCRFIGLEWKQQEVDG